MSIERDLVEVAIGQVKGYLYPTEGERAAAYELLIELSTRTSSAHLASTDDSIRAALVDLEEMFELTRDILRKHGADASKGSGGNLSLAVIAVRVLNEVIRPVLARWQPMLTDYQARRLVDAPTMSDVEWEQRWERGTRCRSELLEMRSSIRAYIDTLSRIAGAPAIADAVLRVPSSTMVPQQKMTADVGTGSLRPRSKMVRWLDLPEMFQTGLSGRPAKASLRAVKRTEEPPTEPTAVFAAVKNQEFWFDYVADMGDGFDGTAPVAWLVGRDRLKLPDDKFGELPTPPNAMPHADLLVFGGDQVYPFAAAGRYEAQTELPYRMGLEGGSTKSPTLIAIPGNHDWLGGLEHFTKKFASREEFAGHWKTVQSGSWWHVQLPQGWWLWGIDTALDNKLVGAQADYFAAAANGKDPRVDGLRPGDRVILCTPVPLWQLRQKDRESYATLRNELDALIIGRGATLPLCLSGDSHFFAHYERLDTDFGEDHITAGGGGAFLQPTHNLPERIPLEDGNAEFKLNSRWPLPADSRSLAPGFTKTFSRQYWPLMVIVGFLQLAFTGLASLGPKLWASGANPGWLGSITSTLASPWGLLMLCLITYSGVFAIHGNSVESKLKSGARVYGLLTGGAMSAVLVAVESVRRVTASDSDSTGEKWVGMATAAVVGGIIAIVALFAMVRWSNSRVKAADTLAFSPAHSTRFKHFLRFRIDRDGDLTCFAVGIDPVGEHWHQAMIDHKPVPPHDRAGIPRLHYVWGKTYRKFVPIPLDIAVSVSDLEQPSTPEVGEPFERLCSVLIDGGHTLMYGGWPDAGYTERLRAIEDTRHASNPNAEHHLINYVADYLWEKAEPARRDDPTICAIRVGRVGPAGESAVDRVIEDLSLMRQHMTGRAEVRIVIGGNLRPGAPGERLAPGIIEEAYLAATSDVPLIVAGGFGGAARLLADAILGRADPAKLDDLAAHFRASDRRTDDAPAVGFREMMSAFNSLGVLRNGLTDGENTELLRSNDVNTVNELIVRSVHRIGSHHAH